MKLKRFNCWMGMLLLALVWSGEALAATCTSLSNGNWNTAGRWSCGHVPLAGDTAVVAHNITLNTSPTVAGLTINSGVSLTGNGNRVVTITGDVIVNGTISNGVRVNVTGAASNISGSGTFSDSRLYTSGAAVTILAGSSLNFTGSSRLYAGRTEGGATVAGSVLTIDGTINSTVTTATTNFLRLYATSTVIGGAGVINASVSDIDYRTATATLTNNGSVSVDVIAQNAAGNAWTQGVNSTLTMMATSSMGTLYASASGNTVTYNGTATPITPSGNTYYNLAGTGVTCPHTFVVLGLDPCALPPGIVSVALNPSICANDASIGVATGNWTGLTNVGSQDSVYATASVANSDITNYLKCTGYGFSIPAGVTITGITVGPWLNATWTMRDNAMQLVKGGVILPTNLATGTAIPNGGGALAPGPTQFIYGSSSNLWGNTWTAADINSANFGAAFAAQRGGFATTQQAAVDTMPITVDYILPANAVWAINRVDPDPTAAGSVSWEVIFGASMTGVSSSNFALVNFGLSGAPAITSVTGSGTTWTVTASTGTGSGTLGLDMENDTGLGTTLFNMPFTGQIYSVRPPAPVTYYHDTTNGVAIGFDGTTNVVDGTNVMVPPIITASLTTANTCTGNARTQNHPAGLFTHSRWYLTTDYAVATNIGANPGGSARIRARRNTDTVLVSLYDYDPVSGAKVLIGSSPTITLTGGGTTTAYPYTITSSLYTVPAGHRLMLQYDFTENAGGDRARVYCSAADSYITVTETPAVLGPDHILISHVGSALTCSPQLVTITACANAACTAPHYSGGANVTLTPGGPGFAIDATGINSAATVQQATAGAVTLDAVSVPAANNVTSCWDATASTASCAMTFSDSGFLVTVPDHISCNNATATIEAVQTAPGTGRCVPAYQSLARAVNLYSSYANPVSGTQGVTASTGVVSTTAPGTAHNLAFDVNGKATITLSYPDAGQLALTAGDTAPSGAVMTGSGSFVVAPASFAFSAIPAAPLIAGQAFNVTVTAMNACITPAATPNFDGTVTLASSNPQPAIGNATAINTPLSGFINGAASANLTWDEVGMIDLNANLASYLGSSFAISGTEVGAGRFHAAYFDTVVTQGCGSFTYAGSNAPARAGQPFMVTVTANKTGGGITQNYAGATYAYPATLSNAGVTAGLASNIIAATSFANGVGSANVIYEVATPQAVPLTLALRATDSDTPALSSAGFAEGITEIRSGRARISNAHGSELLNLPIAFRAEYWNNGWVFNAADTCSGDGLSGGVVGVALGAPPPASCVQDNGSPGLSSAGCVAAAPVGQQFKKGGVAGFAGNFNLWLAAPGTAGAVTVTGSVPAWLQFSWGGGAAINPVGLATFGVYKGSNKFIYQRENY